MPSHADDVAAALRKSGLPAFNPALVKTFGCVSPINEIALTRATHQASWYLAQEQPRPAAGGRTMEVKGAPELSMSSITGHVRVNADTLEAHSIAMGNLIPALAEVQGRKYSQTRDWETADQTSDWELLMQSLCCVIHATHGSRHNVVSLGAYWEKKLVGQLKLRWSDIDEIEFLGKGEREDGSRKDLREDWALLLDFLVFQTWVDSKSRDLEAAEQKEAKRKMRLEIKKDAKMKSACGTM